MYSRWAVSLLAVMVVGTPILVNAQEAHQFEHFLAQQPKIERKVVDGLEITNIVIDQSQSGSAGTKSSKSDKKSTLKKTSPQNNNKGTYPSAGASKAKNHQVKTIPAPKDGTEGSYPTAKVKPKSNNSSAENQFTVQIRPAPGNKTEQTTGVLMPAPAIPAPTIGEPGFQYDSGVLDTATPDESQNPAESSKPGNSDSTISDTKQPPEDNGSRREVAPEKIPPKDKVLSVPYVPKNVQTVVGNTGYPTTIQELKTLLEDPKLTRLTPRYFIDNCMRNAEINKFAKVKVRYNVAPVRGANLLLLAFHMPPLPEEDGQAAKAWILDGNQGIRTIDMRDLPVGVYQFFALALDQNNQPAAKPNMDRFMVRYGGLEALVDYNDRRYILLGAKNDKPAGFADVKLADAVAETPLFKIVPTTCVLRPGDHIVLTAEALPTKHEQRIERIHERYGLKNKATSEGNGTTSGPTKKKRYLWAISGRGRLEVINDNSAIYYAPKDDATGAQISCREEGSDNVVTASMYVTTMPLGEMPRLEEFMP